MKGPKRRPPAERFWPKVDKTDECWLWTGAIGSHGYGMFHDGDRRVLAHRFAYEAEVGPIPEGLHLDHLCRVRPCVRPSHLEPVTAAENNRRVPSPTRCPSDHEYDEFNAYVHPRTGYRTCRRCRREGMRRATAAKKARPNGDYDPVTGGWPL